MTFHMMMPDIGPLHSTARWTQLGSCEQDSSSSSSSNYL